MTRKIIIDTDPGQDDAVAILLALAAPELTLLGITCVAGNVPLPLTHVNARRVCELAGRADIPVYAGCDAPLVRKLVTAEHVHGKTGLDGVDLPAPTLPLAEGHAVDFLIDTLRREAPGTVTLVPIGPLTNIAMAMQRAPRHHPAHSADRVDGRRLFRGRQHHPPPRNSTSMSTRKPPRSSLAQALTLWSCR